LFRLPPDGAAGVERRSESQGGRSLGFPRVVARVDDDDFEHICIELGLEETVIPARTIARYLVDVVHERVAELLRSRPSRALGAVCRSLRHGPDPLRRRA
jgi:hypothetical protein